jgi:hypothetical protein
LAGGLGCLYSLLGLPSSCEVLVAPKNNYKNTKHIYQFDAVVLLIAFLYMLGPFIYYQFRPPPSAEDIAQSVIRLLPKQQSTVSSPNQPATSEPPTSSAAAAALFTPAWLTIDRQKTFKSGALSIIDAARNPPPTKIETVAEPQSESFARAVVDMFILSGFQPRDFGQGDYLGTPTTHRLAAGITIVAPVRSLGAEALRVGFQRIAIQTRRSTDHSRTDDYLVVEVGPSP